MSNNNESVNNKRRVKLYVLNESRQWDDKGTGHVTPCYHEPLDGMSLVVKNEADGSLLLESKIQLETQYTKQQGSLIVWTESDNYDLALSFQEKDGCNEIWEKICEIQGRDPLFHQSDDVEEVRIELVQCDYQNLQLILEQINSCSATNRRRDVLAEEYIQNDYIVKLLAIFIEAEEKKDITALHQLYEIFKQLFLIDKTPLIEEMSNDNNLMNVIGVFEYDTLNITQDNLEDRKKHRDYLLNETKFKEIIPFGDQKIVDKIHQTYRLQYLQSSVLPSPSIIDENAYSTLTNIIFFNKVEIVTMIQDDRQYLKILFNRIISGDTDIESKRDLILFLKEFCTFSHSIQPKQREHFFKTLTSLGILSAIEIALQSADQETKSAAIDVFTYLVEYSPSITRDHVVSQQHQVSSKESMNFMFKEMEEDMVEDDEENETNENENKNEHLTSNEEEDDTEKVTGNNENTAQINECYVKQNQIENQQVENPTNESNSIGSIIDVIQLASSTNNNIDNVDTNSENLTREPNNQTTNFEENCNKKTKDTANILKLVISHITHDTDPELGTATQLSCIIRLLLDPETMSAEYDFERRTFLDLFYSTCMDLLVEPIFKANQDQKPFDRSTAQLLSIVLELLSFFGEHHSMHFRNYIEARDLFERVTSLLKNRHTFLKLSVIKFVRRLIPVKRYNDLIEDKNVFSPIIEVFKENQGRYNLLDSAILEMFEHIQNEKDLDLMDYTYREFGEFLDQIEYVNTFKIFKQRRDSLNQVDVKELRVRPIHTNFPTAEDVDLDGEDDEVPIQRIIKKFRAE